MMHPDVARRLALNFCMQGVGRYLECFNGVVNTYEKELPADFVTEVQKDFEDYFAKMTAADMPVKILGALIEFEGVKVEE